MEREDGAHLASPVGQRAGGNLLQALGTLPHPDSTSPTHNGTQHCDWCGQNLLGSQAYPLLQVLEGIGALVVVDEVAYLVPE